MTAAPENGLVFGWELLCSTIKQSDLDKTDISALLVHFVLIKSNFRCLGVSKEESATETRNPSELFPEEWLKNKEGALDYIRSGSLYKLIFLNVDKTTVIFNFVDEKTKSVSNVMIKLDDIKEVSGQLPTIIPNIYELLPVIQKELVRELTGVKAVGNIETQTQEVLRPPCSMCGGIRGVHPCPCYRDGVRNQIDVHPIGPIGRGDLDPFTPGPGMIFDPFAENHRRPPNLGGIPGPPLPRGAVPPGARFDPFAPPDNSFNPLRRRNPDDFFPDDMFG